MHISQTLKQNKTGGIEQRRTRNIAKSRPIDFLVVENELIAALIGSDSLATMIGGGAMV
jgi:hypothetical protein